MHENEFDFSPKLKWKTAENNADETFISGQEHNFHGVMGPFGLKIIAMVDVIKYLLFGINVNN